MSRCGPAVSNDEHERIVRPRSKPRQELAGEPLWRIVNRRLSDKATVTTVSSHDERIAVAELQICRAKQRQTIADHAAAKRSYHALGPRGRVGAPQDRLDVADT